VALHRIKLSSLFLSLAEIAVLGFYIKILSSFLANKIIPLISLSCHSRGFSPLKEAIEFDQHEVISTLRNCGAHLSSEATATGAELCM
jgi:hypothetical protein